MKKISIITPCYNEEENIEPLSDRVRDLFKGSLSNYDYEHIFIDNCSTDKTIPVLRKLAEKDKKVKVILNTRNFGHIRSPYYAMFQAEGDAVINLVADLQDPPDLIKNFIEEWIKGYKVVVGIKTKSEENFLLFRLRKFYYHLLNSFSESEQIINFSGFVLHDRSVINYLNNLDEPYPYLRGLITELGFERKEIEYTQPVRRKGKTKNNLYTLYDIAMLGFVNHSKVPLRMATFLGFIIALISIFVAGIYLVYKLLYWDEFQTGTAPLIIGLFFFSSVQLIFIGIVGEYVGAIYTQVKKRPLVIEKERINFSDTKEDSIEKS